MASVFSSSKSTLLVDGEAIEGVQSLSFRVSTEREDVRGIGTDERVAVVFGLRTVEGELAVKSTSLKLDALFKDQTQFQLVATLKQGVADAPGRTVSFDECYVRDKSFVMGAGGSGLASYSFSATRLREE